MDATKDENYLNELDDIDVVQNEETARVVDHIAERQLCRKFDMRLMPVLAVMCEFYVLQYMLHHSIWSEYVTTRSMWLTSG